MECCSNSSGNLPRLRHDVVVLGDRHCHTTDIGLLEGVGSQKIASHLAGDSDDGDGVQVGVGKRCHQVSRTRPRGGNAHPDLARSLRIAFRSMSGSLFMTGEHMPQLGRGMQSIVERKHGTAWNAEDKIGSQIFKSADNGVGTTHPLRSVGA